MTALIKHYIGHIFSFFLFLAPLKRLLSACCPMHKRILLRLFDKTKSQWNTEIKR